ncbi:unnamed protein product [Brugia timori]|uniref:Ovule protein n=1 Tax=Brugia timori TaxID=42155 RepID=A0A0R3QCA8_9BILA|nr:unnamed protein product [Brugia timori]
MNRPTNTLKSSLKNGCHAAIAAEKLEVLVRCWLFLIGHGNCYHPRFLGKFTRGSREILVHIKAYIALTYCFAYFP